MDLQEANRLKWDIVARFKAQIDDAKHRKSSADPMALEALEFRGSAEPDIERIVARSNAYSKQRGGNNGAYFVEIALGKSKLVDEELEGYLAYKRSYVPKSVSDLKRVLGWLDQWLRNTDHPPFVADVTRKVATRFVHEELCRGRSRKKASAYLAFLRKYWEWLVTSEFASENVWEGQRIPEDRRPSYEDAPDGGKRPFTDTELLKLLEEPGHRYLPDLMRIAALSGMRIEEICRLKVRDCADGVFKVHVGKTNSATRQVPIHKELLPITTRRCAEKSQGDYLFDELGLPNKKTDTRSSPASKMFTRFRRSRGVDERPNGKPKSNVDFHSFRRWFIRQAKEGLLKPGAAYDAWTICDVVGHDDKGIKDILELTLKRYPGRASNAAVTACVAAVTLPKQAKERPRKRQARLFRRKNRSE